MIRLLCLCALCFAGVAIAQPDYEGQARAALGVRDYEGMRTLCDRWVAYEDSLETGSLGHARALAFRYIAARWLGELGAAEEDARRSLTITRALHGEADPNTITALGNVASLRLLRGDLLEAEVLYREVLALQLRLPAVDDASLARAYNNLAVVLRRQGSWADAEEMYRNALALVSRSEGARHHTTLIAHRNLALTLLAQQRFAEASSELATALAGYDPADSTRIAITVQAMSEVEYDSGDYASARELAHRGYVLRRASGKASSTDAARSAWMLGRIALASGDVDGARRWARESLEELEQALGRLHPHALRSRVLLAEATLAAGDPEGCLRLLAPAPDIYELVLRSAAAGMDRATVDLQSPYPLMARAHARLGHELEAWNAAELSHGKVLGELLDLRLAKLSDDTQRRRAQLSQRLEDLRGALESPATPDAQRIELRRQLFEREAEWAQFERELAKRQGLDADDLPSLREVAALLGPNDLLIGWIDGYVWSLDANARLEWAPCPRQRSGQELRRRILQARDAPAFAQPEEDATLIALERELGEAWFAPLWERLQGRRRLWIIPHAELAGLPFGPLRDREGRALVERFELVLLPSASVWLQAHRARGSSPAGGSLFFGALPANAPTHPRFAKLPQLPSAARELEQGAAIHRDATLLAGANASEAALREWNRSGKLASLELLHFATHAISDPVRPGRSALMALAGDPSGSRASAATDGALTAVEIADTWRLDARLVVLSACETALGRPVPGEGYVGIAHGFFQAGARSLLLSQWEADDESTAKLMEIFYRQWRAGGVDSATALTQAQRVLRASSSHPYYWAAFTLVGAAD